MNFLALGLLALGLLGLGCGAAPERIDYVDALTVYDRNLIIPDAQVYDDAGARMEKEAVYVSHISRAEVVSMTSEGFACVGNGTAVVTLASGSLEHTVLVRCALVGSVEVTPLRLRTVLLRDAAGQLIPQELPLPQVRVLSADGEPMRMDVQVLSSHPERLQVGDERLLVFGQGRVTLAYKAGGRQQDVVVDIGRLVDERMVLRVPPGGKQVIPLQPGLHHAELRSGYRLRAWMVGPSCDPSPLSGTRIEGLECDIGDRGSLVVENPSRGTASVTVRLVVYPE